MKNTNLKHIKGWKVNCINCNKEIKIGYESLDSNIIGISMQCPYCGKELYYGVYSNIGNKPELVLEKAS